MNYILLSYMILWTYSSNTIEVTCTSRTPELQDTIFSNRNDHQQQQQRQRQRNRRSVIGSSTAASSSIFDVERESNNEPHNEIENEINDDILLSSWNNMNTIDLFIPTTTTDDNDYDDENNSVNNDNIISSSSTSLKNKFTKTGTTIVGCIADNGNSVIIGADSRATSGSVVADKQCEKIDCLASNVWCGGAGTSGDIDALTRQIHYTFLLQHTYDSSISNHLHFSKETSAAANTNNGNKKEVIVNPAAICNLIRNTLYDNQGHISANLVVAGYSYTSNKAILVAIHPHGSIDYNNIPFTALGSGSLPAMAILESKYHSNITTAEAVELVQNAVLCGISNDLGSGSQVDLCIITKDGTNYTKSVVKEEVLTQSLGDVRMSERLKERNSLGEETFMRGVSGFGSLPFVMKLRKGSSSIGSDGVIGEDLFERNTFLDQILDYDDTDIAV